MAENQVDFEQVSPEQKKQACQLAPILRMLWDREGKAVCVFHSETESSQNVESEVSALTVQTGDDIEATVLKLFANKAIAPHTVHVEGLGTFTLGSTIEQVQCIDKSLPKVGRLSGKIAIVTGAAQGFGKGIAQALAEENAYVVIADMNLEGAQACASELSSVYGTGHAIAVKVDVSNEASVEAMIQSAVLSYGGLDLFISNAGIAIAGDLPSMTKSKFELVTSVNYIGYFLCAKYASEPLKIQRSVCPEYTSDIIEINSKSGLVGSNKNFAYSGSKFGGIGLTQSFALELVAFGIKVNAICPGNYLDGPLWSDPEKGLFRQYFEAGKVPGAKSVADVRKHYESQVPMNRGCDPKDVARAIFYLVEQQYETGQALPVTGGQIMLS